MSFQNRRVVSYPRRCSLDTVEAFLPGGTRAIRRQGPGKTYRESAI